MINLSYNSKKLLLLQRNELLSEKQKFLRKRFGRLIFTNLLINFYHKNNLEKLADDLFKKEFNTIKKFLPNNVKNVIDVGCGLGLVNIFLNKEYSTKPHFYLLDKNRIDSKIKYGFSSNYESYNNLNETKKLLIDNGIDKENINIYDVEKEINIDKKIDLVISLKSMGYHYPFQNYLKLFKKYCDKETIFIFDFSEGYFKESSFLNYFEKVNIIYEEKGIHSLKRLYCRKFKK